MARTTAQPKGTTQLSNMTPDLLRKIIAQQGVYGNMSQTMPVAGNKPAMAEGPEGAVEAGYVPKGQPTMPAKGNPGPVLPSKGLNLGNDISSTLDGQPTNGLPADNFTPPGAQLNMPKAPAAGTDWSTFDPASVGAPAGTKIVGSTKVGGKDVYVTDTGNVYAPQGNYYGGYSTLDPSARNDPTRKFSGIEATDSGYNLVSDKGDKYGFYNDYGKAPAAPTYKDTPAYLAYVRQMGLEDAGDTASVATQTQQLDQQLSDVLPQVAQDWQRSRRDLGAAQEGRGILRSGETERRMAENREGEGKQTASYTAANAQGKADLQKWYAERVAGRQSREAETGLGIETQERLNQAQIDATKSEGEKDRAAALAQQQTENQARLDAIAIQSAPEREYYASLGIGAGTTTTPAVSTASAPQQSVAAVPAAPTTQPVTPTPAGAAATQTATPARQAAAVSSIRKPTTAKAISPGKRLY